MTPATTPPVDDAAGSADTDESGSAERTVEGADDADDDDTESDTIRILHVDDDGEFVAMTAEFLERADERFDVTAATNVDDGLALLRETAFDAVVSDYDMPGKTGLDFLRAIHAQFPNFGAPFVLLTGKGSEEVAAEALNEGATSYIRKGSFESYDYVTERIRRDVETAQVSRESDRYGTLVRVLNDPVYVVDETGVFTYVNDAFVELVGYDRSALLGATPSLVKSDASVERADSELGRILSADGPDSVTFEVDIETKSGEVVTCEDHMGVLPYEGEVFRGSAGIIRDVSERKRRERQRDETIQFLQDLYDVATDGETSFEEKVSQFLRLGTAVTGLPYGFVTHITVDEESGDGTQTIVEAVGDHEQLQPGATAPLREAYCRRTIDADDLLTVANADAEGWAADPAKEAYELGCYIGAKIADAEGLYGTFCFAATEPREEPFTDAEETFVRFLSQWVSYELRMDRASIERVE